MVPPSAEINDVVCISGCTEIRTSSPGGTIQIAGTDLGSTVKVSFAGRNKRVTAKPYFTSGDRVETRVPKGARTGRVRVIGDSGSPSNFSDQKLEIGKAANLNGSGPMRVTDAEISPAKAYQFGKKRPTLTFVIGSGRRRNDLRIDIVSSSGQVVYSRFKDNVLSGSGQSIAWNGRASDGKPARNGRYRFVVRSVDGTRAKLSRSLVRARRSSKQADPFSFRIYGYVFPLRAPHSYGDGLGAGRGHQGQDVMGNCGSKLIAARAGTVHYNDYQGGGAGNYLVINLKGAGGKSHVYMHMIKPSPLKVGTKVKTGQRIGTVGSTGRSSACHLHFEVWSAPGWYQGGRFIDPTGPLKRWDRYS